MTYNPRDLAHIGCGCDEDTAERCDYNKNGYCSRTEFFITVALERARADGMREAARIAKAEADCFSGSYDQYTVDREQERHDTAISISEAILAAIGETRDE